MRHLVVMPPGSSLRALPRHTRREVTSVVRGGYDDDGTIKAEGRMRGGERVGTWTTHDRSDASVR